MQKRIKKVVLLCMVFILTTSLVGCAGQKKQENNNSGELAQASPIPQQSIEPSSTPAPASQADALLKEMMDLAKKGKVIDCEFAAKTNVIDDVTKKWGEPQSQDWVPTAKGTYADFLIKRLSFGFNKGQQIFEVRSFSEKLGAIKLSNVESVFGKPQYSTGTNSERIIGYKASDEFKLLLVFNLASDSKEDKVLNHYSVLYPAGTVNSMADDPGRQW